MDQVQVFGDALCPGMFDSRGIDGIGNIEFLGVKSSDVYQEPVIDEGNGGIDSEV